jgi:hypothetical protein
MSQNHILLESIQLTQSSATVTLDNIPQTGYTDLKLVVSARGDASSLPDVMMRFNGDTGSNYTALELSAIGTGTPTSGRYTTTDAHFHMNGNTTTASTFSNAEVYIPNYTVTGVTKAFYGDAVNENNVASTLVQSRLIAWRWSGTAAINTINILTNGGNFVAGSTFSLYGIAAVGTNSVIAPFASGGNIVTNDGTYWIHTFTSSGSFTPHKALTCDYLVVGGGGGGEADAGGGGGAGGYRTSIGGSPLSITAQTYAVTIGAGGAGGIINTLASVKGSESVFSTIRSAGGGFGGRGSGQLGGAGGSGGGGSGRGQASGTFAGGTATPSGQGNNGGSGVGSGSGQQAAGGGGGAGAAGANASTGFGGNGGNGLANSISGTSVTYAGGGGGGILNAGNVSVGTGGSGGGGNANNSGGAGTAGTANLGGGGGGSTYNPPNSNGGAGGSGVVIIRYPMV